MRAPTRKTVACFGAVSLGSGKFIRQLCDVFNAVTFEAFLKKLLRHRSRGKRMTIVWDNAWCHHAILRAPLLRKFRNVLLLLFLPPYSPQLAPIECVWKLVLCLATPIATLPHSTNCSMSSRRVSIGGENPITFREDYAGLFKTLCSVQKIVL